MFPGARNDFRSTSMAGRNHSRCYARSLIVSWLTAKTNRIRASFTIRISNLKKSPVLPSRRGTPDLTQLRNDLPHWFQMIFSQIAFRSACTERNKLNIIWGKNGFDMGSAEQSIYFLLFELEHSTYCVFQSIWTGNMFYMPGTLLGLKYHQRNNIHWCNFVDLQTYG
jgi:hypothetical protein